MNNSEQHPQSCQADVVLLKEFPKEEVLNYIMKDVDEKTFDLGVEKGSFQFLYESKKNYLVHNYFNGDVLRFSITMFEILKPYNEDTLRLKDLRENCIKWLEKRIRLSKKYGGNPIKLQEMIKDYNYFVSEFNEKSKPIRKLIYKHYKINKNKK